MRLKKGKNDSSAPKRKREPSLGAELRSKNIETARLFHAIVWTERAVEEIKHQAVLLAALRETPLWSPHVTELLLTTSAHRRSARRMLPTRRLPLVTIGPSTDPDGDLGSPDFEQYCSETLTTGIRMLHGVADATPLPLGILAPPSGALDQTLDKVREQVVSEGSRFVEWECVRESTDMWFCGPSLLQLARKRLILAGVDPARALWLVALDEKTARDEETAETLSLDAMIAAYHANLMDLDPPQPLCINVGGGPLPDRGPWNWEPSRVRTLIDLGRPETKNNKDIGGSLAEIRTTGPISLHPRCDILLNKERFYEELKQHKEEAARNLDAAKKAYYEAAGRTEPWSDKRVARAAIDALFEDDAVFDHRSGAVCFDAYEWELHVSRGSLQEPFGKIVDYFTATREVQWQRDRPNYRRVLASPTKFLLRGEDYYTNLRNEAPTRRLREICSNTSDAFAVVPPADAQARDVREWKLALGLADQLRNAALQIAWFEESLGSLRDFKDLPRIKPPEFGDRIHAFLDAVTRAYYRYLFGRPGALAQLGALREQWDTINADVERLLTALEDAVAAPQATRYEWNLQVTKVIRRWREADHPGENAFVALLAADRVHEAIPAIGIGWGGIEMPLAFRHVMEILGHPLPPVFAAHFSKYARAGAKKPRVVPLSPDARKEALKESRYVIFDDNSLSGATLQVVIEHLWHDSRARPKLALISRFSGERRYDQMRMEKEKRGGLLDPRLLHTGSLVQGYLGETPFSRSLSRDVYQNPIGVFSLAKRRILELLHSNSSADRFDREGF